MKLRGKRFVPLLVCVALVVIGIVAGNWQTRRAEQKLALQARLEAAEHSQPVRIGPERVDPAALDLHPAVAHGVWLADKTVLIDNRVLNGRVGYQVATPLKLDGTDLALLVFRGWIAGNLDRSVPEVLTPAGPVEVSGELRTQNRRAFELSHAEPQGRVWQNLDLDHFARWSGLNLQPLVLMQTSNSEDGLTRAWDRPDLGIAMHRGYAFQWYGLALATFLYFIFTTLRGRKRRDTSSDNS